MARGPRIDVVLGSIFGRLPRSDNAHQVVGAEVVVSRLHLGRNLVVRLGRDRVESRDQLRVVVKRPKGQDFGHGSTEYSAAIGTSVAATRKSCGALKADR